jgi:predicted Zn-dependent peptidase
MLSLPHCVRHTILDNSVEVITESLPWLESATVGIWLEAGSRDETLKTNGIAHFYEHMVFKGTKRYSALETVHAIESKGGYLNAFTSRETTCFYARVTGDQLPVALDILASMVTEPLLEQEAFDLEKTVILEEVKSADDAPDEQVADLFTDALWGQKDLGMPIAGTVKTVQGLKLADLHHWQDLVLNEHRVVVSVAGQVDHDAIVAQIQKLFAVKKSGQAKERPWFEYPNQHATKTRKLQQGWVMLGTKHACSSLRERLALNLFNGLFGDGMASRLFQNIREKHGLVYSIYSSADFYFNQNSFNVTFSSDGSNVAKTMELIKAEAESILNQGIKPEELDFAKHMIRGNLLLGLEGATARMNRIARQALYKMPIESAQETVKEIFSIELPEVQKLAEQTLSGDWATAWLGPKTHQVDLSQMLWKA